jgi:hypothetical protein
MGCELTRQVAPEKAKNAQIEAQLTCDRRLQDREIKVLMLGKIPIRLKDIGDFDTLGTGDSGKSTVMKQLKFVRGGGYSQGERHYFKPIILDDIIRSMQTILEAMADFEISVENSAAAHHLQAISMQGQHSVHQGLPPDVYAAIKVLWNDAGVQECYSRRSEYQVNDSAR